MSVPKGVFPSYIMISVPKRRLHHAVDRNRVKRQVREAYRLNRQLLWDRMANKDCSILMAFVFVDDTPVKSEMVHKSIRKALFRIAENYEKGSEIS